MSTPSYGDLDLAPAAERTEFGPGKVAIDEELCSGCSLCSIICPARLLEMVRRDEQRTPRIRPGQENCMACGCCEAICETGAIKLALPYDYGGKWKQLDRGELSLPRNF